MATAPQQGAIGQNFEAAFAVKGFGGMMPRTESRMLPDANAEIAVNCDLQSGVIQGLPIPEPLKDLTAQTGTVLRAYRFPGPNPGDPDVWLPLPSQFSSVTRSPLANDTAHRIYWTNPNDGAYWATYDMVADGATPYALGIVQPSTAAGAGPTVTSSGGGAGGVTEITRSYTYTFVNAFGEESAPCTPSDAVSGYPDGTWTISNLPQTAPDNPAGYNYPAVVGMILYRTSTGTSTGAQFYRVWQFSFADGVPSSFVDTVQDTQAVNNLALYSTSFGNPPAKLDGLTALPGGMLVAFTGNTVHFCEPDRPHAWPAAYDQSLEYPIVGLAVWQQSLVTLTMGYPSTGSGTSPSAFTFSQLRVPEPCLSRGSIITDLMGVYYASQNGLIMLNYFGMQNQTLATITKNVWLTNYKAASIQACRHRSQYLAINGSNTGFLIDYAEQRLGFMNLSTFSEVSAIWNDEYNGNTYIMANKVVYLWDSPNTGHLTYRWRSKQFYFPSPSSLGAVQISLDPSITDPAPVSPIPLDNGDPTLELPDGINAVFRLYAGPDGANLVMQRSLTTSREIFRLPSGFKAFDWQFEVVARCGIRSIELASTMRGLKGV